jgi:hypothetical protein
MNFLKQNQNYIMIGVIVIAAFVAYSYFFTGKQETVLTQENATTQSDVDKELIALLFELKAITLDDAIFSSPVFQSLEDFSQALVPEPVGRTNPFAPFGGSSQSAPPPKK